MAWGTPSWVVHLSYCRTISDLSLHRARLHCMLSSKDFLEKKGQNTDACFIIAVSFSQNNKYFSTIWRLGTEGMSLFMSPF